MTTTAQPGVAPRQAPSGSASTSRRAFVLLVACLIVVGSVGWRRGEYFTGSLDPVVLAKAALSFLALGVAFLLAQSATRRRLGTASLWWLGLVLVSSVFGAYTADKLLPGGVVAVRVAVLAATVFFLLRAAAAVQVLTSIAWACGGVAVVASVTGLATLSEGRLAGGIPALSPNELALLAGTVILFLAWRTVLGTAGWIDGVAGVFFLGVVWATGSRTGLLMLLVAVLVMGLHIRRPRVGLVVGALVLGSLGAVGVVATGFVTGFVERDGDGVSTLESRFIAWRAAVSWAESGWQQVFGAGLSTKIIQVKGQWWDTQPLDSSWASLLVQAGVLGLALAAGWASWAFVRAFQAPRPHRVLFVGLLVFLVGRSIVESGLFDATPAFLLFLAVSLLAEGGSRERVRAEASDERVPAP